MKNKWLKKSDLISMIPEACDDNQMRTYILNSFNERWLQLNNLLETVCHKATKKNVHELRIALRRLNAALSMTESIVKSKTANELREYLDKLLKRLSKLRDAQVQYKEIKRITEQYPALSQFERSLFKSKKKLKTEVEKWFDKHHKKPLKTLYTAHVVKISQPLQVKNASLFIKIGTTLQRLFQDVIVARLELNISNLNTLHRLRISLKKYRYFVEELAPVLTDAWNTRIQTMKNFQTILGDVHDFAMLNQVVMKYRLTHKKCLQMLLPAQDDIAHFLLNKTDVMLSSVNEIFIISQGFKIK